jgi:RimJ/RimL family protein N-acetyltransferase
MLRQARPSDLPVIDALWRAPQNARWIEPPDEGEIEASIDAGHAFLWHVNGQPQGFATLMTWVPRVFGLSAIACTQGQGKQLLGAVLAHVFGALNAHRIGFDVTADNARAIRLYESFGFQREGLVRECWQRPATDDHPQDWADCLLMGLLAREWRP